MSVSNKVALYAMIPAAGILLFGFAAIFTYNPAIEAIVSIISSLVTSVTLLFLISERLRESARHKLDFVNKKALTPALKVGEGGIIGAHEGEAAILQQCCELLKHSGKFLKVKLYPKNLITTLETAKDSMFAYHKSYQKLLGIGSSRFGPAHFNILALLVVLGILAKGDYQEPTLKTAREHLDSLKKTDSGLVEEFSHKGSRAASDMGQIKKKIEGFYVENQLEEVPERDYFQPP